MKHWIYIVGPRFKGGYFVLLIKQSFQQGTYYSSFSKDIPKPNGKTRPLGIPCIWDRLVQQCIKQVIEPICEAKFSDNSYGFRPNRSVEHAVQKTYTMLQRMNLHLSLIHI